MLRLEMQRPEMLRLELQKPKMLKPEMPKPEAKQKMCLPYREKEVIMVLPGLLAL